jgi:predicted peroxiredoxin
MLGKIFIPKEDEVNEQFKILCNKELCDLYSSPNIVLVATNAQALGGIPFAL